MPKIESSTISSIQRAQGYITLIESTGEPFYDYRRISLARDAWQIFKDKNMTKEVKQVEYLACLQQHPTFIDNLTNIDLWNWALENFLKKFDFLSKESHAFYHKRLKKKLHTLARARYQYAICCWDSNLIKKHLPLSAKHFINYGLKMMENRDSIATIGSKELNFGLNILKMARYQRILKRQVIKTYRHLKLQANMESINHLIPYFQVLSSFLDYLSLLQIKILINKILLYSKNLEMNKKIIVLDSFLKWKKVGLESYIKKIHQIIALTYHNNYLLNPNKIDSHQLRKGAIHAHKAGIEDLSENLLVLAEKDIKKQKLHTPISQVQQTIPYEDIEQLYEGIARQFRGPELLLVLAYNCIGDVNEEFPVSELRQIFHIVEFQGQTLVETIPGADRKIIESMRTKAVMVTQTYISGINYYLSKRYISYEDLHGVFLGSGLHETAPFIYEANELARFGFFHGALHLLIPTFERLCHEILSNQNRSSTYISQNGTHVHVLSSLLRIITEMNIISDAEFEFVLLQLDKHGRNIRNRVCHGLTEYNSGAYAEFWLTSLLSMFLLIKYNFWLTKKREKRKRGE